MPVIKSKSPRKKAGGGLVDPRNYDSDVDYREARDKSMMGVPSSMKTTLKSIKKDIRGEQDDYAAKQREWFAKSVAAAKAKKAMPQKASGGSTNKGCW